MKIDRQNIRVGWLLLLTLAVLALAAGSARSSTGAFGTCADGGAAAMGADSTPAARGISGARDGGVINKAHASP